MHAYVEAKGDYRDFCPVSLHLIPLRQGISLNLEVGKWIARDSDPSVSPLSTGVIGVHNHIYLITWVLGI